MIKIIMHGCNGKMGQVITKIAEADSKVEIVAGVDQFQGVQNPYPVFSSMEACDAEADVVIDFSNAAAVDGLLDYCVNRQLHHNQKVDAPSGTALALADSVNEALDHEYTYVYDRSQYRKKREEKEIGISAVRGGTIVGEHEVIFAGMDEVIEFKHTAYSRSVFGKGAVEAAKFLAGKTAGMYDMSDVIQF